MPTETPRFRPPPGERPPRHRLVGESDIHWPSGFTPDDADRFDHHEVFVEAPPSVVWHHLVEVTRWPEWYPQVRDIRLLAGERLEPGSRFGFDTLDGPIDAAIGEIVEPVRLGWFATGDGTRSYHAWLITAVEGGCVVVSEEVALGRRAMGARGHTRWLPYLKHRAERPA